ncbi:MAG TPA: DUF3616 domain-containing protein [Longimicrobiaceae bacterium]
MQIPFTARTPTPPRSVLLRFETPGEVKGKDLRDGLSAIAHVGPHVFVASDEGSGLERLTTRDGGATFAEHRSFPLAELLDLPGGDEEVDVEGLNYREPYLWMVGSHSLKRKKPDPEGEDTAKEVRRLSKVVDEPNRYLLARIPLSRDPETGEYTPVRSCADPSDPERALTAARLKGDGRDSQLMRAMADDPHFGPFLGVPGKDNGFDVEGLALAGDRVILGLRGPVLRGWAAVLVVEPVESGDPGVLKLKRIGPDDRRYLKHFLDLGGLGVREVSTDGDDLLLLAGPTQVLDGPVALFRWRGGAQPGEESLVGAERLETVMPVPWGEGPDAGKDHPEGMSLMRGEDGSTSLLIVHDSPVDSRKTPDGGVRVDRYPL